MEHKLSSQRFDIEDSASYKGFKAEGLYWNGWECPFFTKEVAEQILNDFEADWIFVDNTFYVCWEGDGPNDEPEEYGMVLKDGIELWSIGGFAWCWQMTYPIN